VAHRIGKHENIGSALRRLIVDDLVAARAELTATGPAEERIHRVRQRLKRARSLLRAQAPSLDGQAKLLKRDLAAAARLLAGARDADAAAASARGLLAKVGDGEGIGLDRVVATLDCQAETAHQAAPPVAEVIDRLATAERRLAAMPARVDRPDLLDKALIEAYRRGRDTMRRARSSLATPDLHRWRKAVKDLWHLVRLARKRLPRREERVSRQLEKLGELLGLDHDHAMLAERLALSPPGDPALMRQLSLIAKERRALETAAFALGASVYRKRPRVFAKRLSLR
jgi:CHAD domain-containing protein